MIQRLDALEQNATSRGLWPSRICSQSSREDRRRPQLRPKGDSLPMLANAVTRRDHVVACKYLAVPGPLVDQMVSAVSSGSDCPGTIWSGSVGLDRPQHATKMMPS